jgi:phosphoglycerate kinase
MGYLRGLKSKNMAGKVCILRAGFDTKGPKDSLRLERAIPTIKFLLKNKSRVLIISHHGRPRAKDKSLKKFSLRAYIPFLEKNLKRKISFLKSMPKDLSQDGDVFMLENLRFFPGEKKNDPKFAKRLAALGDFYVNDAFSNSHRRHASMVAIAKYLPSYAGLSLEEEMRHLGNVLKKPEKPFVVIFGGAKIEEKIHVIKNLLPKASKFLLGSSIIDRPKIGIRSPKIVKPIDWISEKNEALDIGPLTVEMFAEIIRSAETIVWSGPLGKFEDKRFLGGSASLAKLIAKSQAFSVVGGGETTQLVKQLGLEKRYSFLSTGGGAMLEFLAGKKLPGIIALERSSRAMI